MRTTVLVLWWLAVALESAACLRLCTTGMVRRFPVLTARFGAGATFLAILYVVRQGHSSAYPAVFSMAVLFATLLETGCVVEVFFALAGKFRNFVRVGGGLLAILWVIAIVAAAAVRFAWVPAGWTTTWQMTLLATRYVNLVMALVVVASWLLLRLPGLPIAQSATRAAGIILFHILYGFVVSTVTIAKGGVPYFWMQVFPLAGGCLVAGGAIALLRFVPDEYALPPAPSREEFEHDMAESDRAMQYLEDTRRDLLRGLNE